MVKNRISGYQIYYSGPLGKSDCNDDNNDNDNHNNNNNNNVAEWIPGRRDDPTDKQNHLT